MHPEKRLNDVGSTTARASSVKKRTLVVRKNTGSSKSTDDSRVTRSGTASSKKPSVPAKPSVTKGPVAVKRSKSGKHTVARFFVAQFNGHNPFHTGKPVKGAYESKWYVMDMESGQRARGTERDGYGDWKDAQKVAKEYRDKYGAYVEVPY